MTKYESKKNPGTFLTTDGIVDPKTKTVFVTLEDGKEKTISIATLKRWWTKVEDNTEPVAPVENVPESNPAEAKAPATENETAEPAEQEAPNIKEPSQEEAPVKKPAPKKKRTPKVKAPKTTAIILPAETSDILIDMYDKLNGLYFDDLLPEAVITVRHTKRIYDCCSVKKNGESYEILMCAGTLGNSVEEVAAAMLHAMVHLYCAESEIAETCQNGRYHNAKFKAECESRDLVVEYDRANGHVHTKATEIFTGKLREAGVDLNAQLMLNTNVEERA